MKNEQKQMSKNAEDVKILTKDLQQGAEIKQKIEYYKSILKAYDELSEALQNKIKSYDNTLSNDDSVIKNRLIIEQLDISNVLFEKKKFYEMWLKRSKEYEETFKKVTEDCNKNFDEYLAKAKEFAEKNIKLKTNIERFEKEEPTQENKNSFYLFIKYEVIKLTGKGVFAI